jgi:hypothetical protein
MDAKRHKCILKHEGTRGRISKEIKSKFPFIRIFSDHITRLMLKQPALSPQGLTTLNSFDSSILSTLLHRSCLRPVKPKRTGYGHLRHNRTSTTTAFLAGRLKIQRIPHDHPSTAYILLKDLYGAVRTDSGHNGRMMRARLGLFCPTTALAVGGGGSNSHLVIAKLHNIACLQTTNRDQSTPHIDCIGTHRTQIAGAARTGAAQGFFGQVPALAPAAYPVAHPALGKTHYLCIDAHAEVFILQLFRPTLEAHEAHGSLIPFGVPDVEFSVAELRIDGVEFSIGQNVKINEIHTIPFEYERDFALRFIQDMHFPHQKGFSVEGDFYFFINFGDDGGQAGSHEFEDHGVNGFKVMDFISEVKVKAYFFVAQVETR